MPKRAPMHRAAGYKSKVAKPNVIVSTQAKKRYDKQRPSAAKRGYDRKWQKVRKLVLMDEPLCRFCKERGRVKEAEHVDHIDGNSFNNNRDNLRPLCARCHNQRTARDQAFGRKNR